MRKPTLREQIISAAHGTIFFRSDFPHYHPESVGRVLSDLAGEGVLTHIASGIYVKPQQSKFGLVMPSVDQIVGAVAQRDMAKVLPSGATALNALGLSTQVPMSYSYLTTGSARVMTIGDRKVVLKRGVPRNFAYKTQLIALMTQALRSLGEKNITEEHLGQIRSLIKQEDDIDALAEDVSIMPEWMRRIIKPMINIQNEKAVGQ